MSRARFQPTRAGIINLWDYRDQEFSFADGRLVLRGPNGSGKTKALEVLFPFVLDGRIEPRRLNPFAGEERTMKSNLLYRGQDSSYSYVWMEFCRGPQEDPEAVTIGIGMRATRSNDKVTRWYFVAEGKVGHDFSLLGPDDRPLTKKQLGEQIGTDCLSDRAVDYRSAIDERMFGLGSQRYDQLITLILTLRRPQLAKNLDPKSLSQALTDGLRPLDEHLLLEAARSFSAMEEVGRTLEGLVAADRASRGFVGVYTAYLHQHARSDIDRLASRLAAVDTGIADLRSAQAEYTRSSHARTLAEREFALAERELEQATENLDALERSTAYEGRAQLDDLTRAVAIVERSTELHKAKADKARTSVLRRSEDTARADASVTRLAAARARAEDELQSAAAEAGIAWTAADTRSDQFTITVHGHSEERAGDIRTVRAALTAAEKADAERARADQTARRNREQLDLATATAREAETRVELARLECGRALKSWWNEYSGLYTSIGVASSLVDVLDAAAGRIGEDDAPTLAEVLTEHTADALESIRFRRRQARSDIEAATETIAELRRARSDIAAEGEDAPSAATTDIRPRADLPGAPFWRLVRFREGVDATVASGVEAALHAADLLDGWVHGGTGPLPDSGSAHLLLALPEQDRPSGRTLTEVLEVEPDTGVPADRVHALLESIVWKTDDSPWPQTAVAVAGTGSYRHGVRQGSHTKSEAEYIGATARARRRAARIEELDQAITAIETELTAAELAESDAEAILVRANTASRTLPRTSAVLTALRSVTESAGLLRSHSETVAAADRDLDRALAGLSAAEKHLHSTAVAHRTPATAPELDSLAASIRHFEKQGELVLRYRNEHLKELEYTRETHERLEEARRSAEELAAEAAVAEENLARQTRRLDTLRESVGAGAEQIDAQLDEAHARIAACTQRRHEARKADRDAGEAIGRAEAARAATAAALRSAVSETRSDAATLAPYARVDLLEILGIDTAHHWPSSAAAWTATDHILDHIESVDSADQILPTEVMALYRALRSATESVHAGEAARKATRTALTTALHEFDTSLTSAGQNYHLRWDAPDGITLVQIQDERGFSSVVEFASRIATARADQELLITESERRILEDALLSGLAQQIHERTLDARHLIARMSAEMRERRMSSGNTIGVHWVLADNLDEDARAISKLLDHETSTLTTEDLAAIRAHFAARIRTARAEHPERSYPEILSSTLDYRRWRVFTFTLVGVDGTEERLTVARHSTLSGGEQSVSLHLPLFAAAHVMLDSADPHAPRLLALDEAFAGVDDNGRGELLGLSVQFDLDLFMTGYDLWITYPGVPGCAHYDLAHSTAEHSVSAALLVWSGGELLAEHDRTDLARALGSPLRRRVPSTTEGTLEFA